METPSLNVPEVIIKGDTVSWISSGLYGNDPVTGLRVGFTSSDYALKWRFSGKDSYFEVAAIGHSNSAFKTTLTGTQTATFSTGTGFYHAAIETPTGESITVGTGSFVVREAGSAGYDGESVAQKMLKAVEEALLARLSGGSVASYSIGGRSLSYMSPNELIALRYQLRTEVDREKRAENLSRGKGDAHQLLVRFDG